MFKNLFSVNRFSVPFIVLVLLLIPFFVYSRYYVTANQAYLNERGFRLLSAIGSQLETIVNSYANVFRATAGNLSDEEYQSWLKSVVSDTKRVYRKCKPPDRIHPIALLLLESPGSLSMLFDYSGATGNTCEGKTDPLLKTETPLAGWAPVPPPQCEKNAAWQVCGAIPLGEPLRSVVDAINLGFFDNVLVADGNGKVLFQSSNDGFVATNINHLLLHSIQGGKPTLSDSEIKSAGEAEKKDNGSPATDARVFRAEAATSLLVETNLGGGAYKLFLQPIEITAATPRRDRGVTVVLAGAVRAARLDAESTKMPYPVVIWGALLVLTATSFLWPFLKINYMSPTERLRRRQTWYLVLTTILASVLITMSILNWSYVQEQELQNRRKLMALAAAIQEKARSELASSVEELRRLAFHKKFIEKAQELARDKTSWSPVINLPSRCELSPPPGSTATYHHFDQVFWTDAEGSQRIKLLLRPPATPQTIVSDYEFFSRAMNDEFSSPPDWPSLQYSFQPLHSPNTGEFQVIIGARFDAPNFEAQQFPWIDAKEFKARAETATEAAKTLKFQALVLRPLSLVDPVLPPGFGFAIVNREGRVLFHSESTRNLQESFLDECRKDRFLSAALFSGNADFHTIDYLGEKHQAYVTTIAGMESQPLSLIVFRDSRVDRTANLAIVLFCSILLGFYALPFLTLAIIDAGRRRTKPPSFVWPREEHSVTYFKVFTSTCMLLTAFFASFTYLPDDWLLASAIAVAIISTVFAVRQFEPETRTYHLTIASLILMAITAVLVFFHGADVEGYIGLSIGGAGLWMAQSGVLNQTAKYFKRGYALVVVAGLVAVAVVPSFAFFRVSFNAVQEMVMRRDQLKLREQLQQRRARIEHEYRDYRPTADSQDPAFVEDRIGHPWAHYETLAYGRDRSSRFFELSKSTAADLPLRGSFLQWLLADAASCCMPANPIGAEMSATALASNADSSGKGLHVSEWNRPNAEVADLRVAKGFYVRSWYPKWPGLPPAGFLCFAVLGAGLWLWTFNLMNRVFLPDAVKPPRLPGVNWQSAADITHNYMVIGHPLSGKSTRLAKLGIPVLDLRVLLPKWKDGKKELPATVVAKQSNPGGTPLTRLRAFIADVLTHLERRETSDKVVLDHFDYQMDDCQSNVARLELLEDLVYKHKKIVVMATTVEPQYYLADRIASIEREAKDGGSSPAGDDAPGKAQDATPLMIERWARVLSEFTKVELADQSTAKLDVARLYENDPQLGLLARTIVCECDATAYLRWAGCDLFIEFRNTPGALATKDDVIAALLDRVESYYGMLWSTLTESERLVLYQLASDGWANPRNHDAILQLQRKELVRDDKGYQVMNESFALFVLSAPHAAEHRRWELRERESSWHSVKIGFWTLLMAGMVWILYAQRDLFQVSIGYVVTLTGAMTAVVNLLGSFRSRLSRAPDAK